MDKGILNDYKNKTVTLIMDLGDLLIGSYEQGTQGQGAIKVEGMLIGLKDEPLNMYTLLISGWKAELTFAVAKAKVTIDLGESGSEDAVTITVLPEEIF